jgi:antitoxin component of MazEF toxin-antitoxin module
MTNRTWTYAYEDIFEEIPDDPGNISMTIPPEICEQIGLVPGDTVRILKGDQGTVIIEKVRFDENGERILSEVLSKLQSN